MNLTLPHFIHFILVYLFVPFLILIISIIKYRLGCHSCKSGIKSSKTKTAVFTTAILFFSSDENGVQWIPIYSRQKTLLKKNEGY